MNAIPTPFCSQFEKKAEVQFEKTEAQFEKKDEVQFEVSDFQFEKYKTQIEKKI